MNGSTTALVDSLCGRAPAADGRTGLVLSGGAVRGAYEAGVIRALAERGVRIDAISGASVGALNGAILAAAPSPADGAGRLQDLWSNRVESAFMLNYVAFVEAAGAALQRARASLGGGTGWADVALTGLGFIRDVAVAMKERGAWSNEGIRRMLSRWAPPHALASGIPLHVSLSRSRGLGDFVNLFAVHRNLDTEPPVFMRIRDLDAEQRHEAILASAAIPFGFEGRTVNGVPYVDGGIGGWATQAGNTPVRPLVEDEGCRRIFVVVLQAGSPWRRDRFPGADIVEIRPAAADLPDTDGPDLDRSPGHVEKLLRLGHEDALRALESVL